MRVVGTSASFPGFDYGKLNVEVTGLLSATPQVPTVLDEGQESAGLRSDQLDILEWYYDNNSRPTRIIACNATCKAIHQSAWRPRTSHWAANR